MSHVTRVASHVLELNLPVTAAERTQGGIRTRGLPKDKKKRLSASRFKVEGLVEHKNISMSAAFLEALFSEKFVDSFC